MKNFLGACLVGGAVELIKHQSNWLETLGAGLLVFGISLISSGEAEDVRLKR